MIKRWAALGLVLCLLLQGAMACAEENIIRQCEFQVNSNHGWLPRAYDGKPDTYWASDTSGGRRYLQITKDKQAQVIWQLHFLTPPVTLELYYFIDSQQVLQYTYEEIGDTLDVPIPPGIRYARLYVEGERLAVKHMEVLRADSAEAMPIPTQAPVPTPAPTAVTMPKPTLALLQTVRPAPVKTQAATPGITVAASAVATAPPVPPTATPPPTASPTPAASSAPALTVPATIAPTPSRPPMPTATPAPNTYPLTGRGIVDFANSQMGAGYIIGAYGQVSTKDFRYGRADLYPSYAELIHAFGTQWDGGLVYDCIGLFKAFALQGGAAIEIRDVNVTKAFRFWVSEHGPLEGAVLQPGMALLRMEGRRTALPHIGIYAGDGWVIHARGTRWGVVRTRVPDVFTHWAKLNWIEYDLPFEETVYTDRVHLGAGDYAFVDTDDAKAAPVYGEPVESGKKKASIGTFLYGTVVTVVDAPDEMSRLVTGIDARGQLLTGYVRLTSLSPID